MTLHPISFVLNSQRHPSSNNKICRVIDLILGVCAGPVLLLDILSNTAVVYRYAGWVFGVEQGKPLETIEQVRTRPDLTDQLPN